MSALWDRFCQWNLRTDRIGFALDVSRMRFPDGFIEAMSGLTANAFAAMRELEAGAIANPDEGRMVGHYWLRAPELAPKPELRREIEETRASIEEFAAAVHAGRIAAANGRPFTEVLLIGIGGSALGPQFVADALGTPADRMRIHFLDNVDPDGFDRAFARLADVRAQLLVVVISKSGGTKETRNGMLETAAFFAAGGVDFARQAVAVTGAGSELDRHAIAQGWLKRFPMWDWVGGRTSVMSAVGLVPAALQGIDLAAFLAGAAAMDGETRLEDAAKNPAMLLALMWHFAGDGRGRKDMVVLPYKDRLVLFSKYLQQLVMESLGKERDLAGNVVNQGIAVYGNKGSTDQHAYVQQLREGVLNFFTTFIEVRAERPGPTFEVEPGVTSGDYLHGFFRGTRSALYENGRDSITITIEAVDAFHVGLLIALFERAVGFYASLVGINAYHQPGVEAGKKAAVLVLELQASVVDFLNHAAGQPKTATQVASALQADPEATYHVLNHLAASRPEIAATRGGVATEDTFAKR